jgi:DNA (cytosine-5)-methyltransferase 1
VQTGYGERDGQAARVPGLDKPLGTVVAGGPKHALVAAFLARQFGYIPPEQRKPGNGWGGVVGQELERPTSTVTAKDHHALTAATLVKLRGENHGADLRAPLPTVTAGGFHIGEVRAFLTAYYGTDLAPGQGQDLREPTRTLTTKARLGLVTVEGVDYQIVDIGMRMLEPHELLSAQFGRFAPLYDLSAARTKSGKVRLIGNSVCPEVAEALVRANVRDGVAVDGYAAA